MEQETTDVRHRGEGVPEGMVEINTNDGRKVVNENLSEEAQGRIVEVYNSMGGQQVKVLFEVSSNGFKAAMRIDLVGQLFRGSAHAGARVTTCSNRPFPGNKDYPWWYRKTGRFY